MSKHTPATGGLIIRQTDLQQAIDTLASGDIGAVSSQLEGMMQCAPLCNRQQARAAPELLAALMPLATWAENERRKHRALEEEEESAYMGELADNAKAAIAAAQP